MQIDDIKIFVKKEKNWRQQTIRICSQDIGMDFGIEKCAMLIMKKGRNETTDVLQLLNQENIKTFDARKLKKKNIEN